VADRAQTGPGDGRRPILVLGSASPARATLLRAAGITPTVWHSRVDEDALIAAAGDLVVDPPALTRMLATAKARDVAEQVRAGEVPDLPADARVLVIAADSMLDFEGRVLGKARSAQEVRDRWAAMSGHAGVLVTGHAVIDLDEGREVGRAVATTVRFGRPDPVELEAYIASGEPLAVAGSCTIDGLGGPFIEGIEGDHTNVIGLALPTLRALLAELGIRWTDLWDRP
jgi:septum formation protein